ncbi:MAG: hypothetical protein HUU23_13475 [Caldilineales bacterium]|nr:hypothetical protein [Caldilineales bacterium]
MTHKTNLYAGWWVYAGLAGLGALLLLASFGGAGLWLAALLLAGGAVAAFAAWRGGFSPRRQLIAELSERGLHVHSHPPPASAPPFYPWRQIKSVRVLPRPGYWQTAIQTVDEPDRWQIVGHSLELAEQIAEIAGLAYDEHSKRPTPLGHEHYWR